MRIGCYDAEIFTESRTDVPAPHRSLRREPLPRDLEPRQYGRIAEEHVTTEPQITGDSIGAWIRLALVEPCGPSGRFETSLRDLYVQAERLVVPPTWAHDDVLEVVCPTGTIEVPIEKQSGLAWIAAPHAGAGMYLPIALRLDNLDDGLAYLVQVYWTPWVGELARQESPLAQAVARLVERGWRIADE